MFRQCRRSRRSDSQHGRRRLIHVRHGSHEDLVDDQSTFEGRGRTRRVRCTSFQPMTRSPELSPASTDIHGVRRRSRSMVSDRTGGILINRGCNVPTVAATTISEFPVPPYVAVEADVGRCLLLVTEIVKILSRNNPCRPDAACRCRSPHRLRREESNCKHIVCPYRRSECHNSGLPMRVSSPPAPD